MQTLLVFDVDGTLTGPRRRMHEDFARFFKSICRKRPVFLVSGSDMPKLEQQLPRDVIDLVTGIFPCSGNEFILGGQTVYRMEHYFPDEMVEYANELVANSPYPERTGVHIESRTGTLNVSVIGRNADHRQRIEYYRYDKKNAERNQMIKDIMRRFPQYEANSGGQISVDISPRGWNKSRVWHELNERFPGTPVAFFGDNMKAGGNDRALGNAVMNGSKENFTFPVDDHYDTWRILQDKFIDDDAQLVA